MLRIQSRIKPLFLAKADKAECSAGARFKDLGLVIMAHLLLYEQIRSKGFSLKHVKCHGRLCGFLRNNDGFTLLEILVAALVLSVGFFGMVSVATSIMQGNTFSGRVTAATTLAQHKIEEIRRLGYSDLPDTDTTDTEDYNTISGHPLFKRMVSISVSHAADGLKMVTVTVCWDAGNHKVTLKTLVGK